MNKKIEFKDFEIKELKEDQEGLTIVGYGAVFNNIDSYGDVIKKGAFAKTIKEMGDRIAFCYQHDIWNPIGKIKSIAEDDFGLLITVKISDAEDDIKTKIKEGILKEMSIGYRTIASNDSMVDGVEIRQLTEIKLFEISIVTIAANPLAVIEGMKSIEEQTGYIEKEFDRLIGNEKSHNKQFELLRLKTLCTAQPYIKGTEQIEPSTVTLEQANELIKQSFKTILS